MPTVLDLGDLIGGDNPADDRSLPVIIRGNQSPCTVVQLQCGISQYIGNAKWSELRTNATYDHRLWSGPLNNEPANHHVSARLNKAPSTDVTEVRWCGRRRSGRRRCRCR